MFPEMIITSLPLRAVEASKTAQMELVRTYVEGFDEALGGGIPRGSLILICGTPGTMKTSLAFSIAYNNVRNNGSKGLYITLEESNESLKADMEDMGLTGIEKMELHILDVARIRLEHKEEEMTKNWLEVLMKYIDHRVRVNKFDIVVIDSLAALYSLNRFANPRQELFHFFGFLKNLGATVFLISEIPTGQAKMSSFDEDFLADGVFYVKQYEMGETDVQLRIRCVKLRRRRHKQGYFALLHENGKFAIANVISE